MKFDLRRTKQCAKCPWKTSTDPHDIPDGYCEIKHKNLSDTIADPGKYVPSDTIKIMACHHSKDIFKNAEHCVGWLYNQIGVGNNIALRLRMMHCNNINELKVYGEQHLKFEDTLPKK